MKRWREEQFALKNETLFCVSVDPREGIFRGFINASEVRWMKMNERSLKFLCWDYLKNDQTKDFKRKVISDVISNRWIDKAG